MLAEKYNEYNVLEEQRLLKELLGVKSEKEVYELIKKDMLDFTGYVDTHITQFLDNERGAYLAFNTIFDEFMRNYKTNLEKLAELKRQHLELLDLSDYIGQNDLGLEEITNIGLGVPIGTSEPTNIQGKLTTVIRNGEEIQAQIIGGNEGRTYDLEGNLFEFQDGDIVKTGGGDYRWTQGEDGVYKGVYVEGTKNNNYTSKGKSNGGKTETGLKETTVTGADGKVTTAYINKDGQTVNKDGTAYSFKDGDTVKTGGGNYKVSIKNGKITGANKVPSYSYGIENGPVTYTGLAMLHGSSANPEYVLNSDQAYSLLRYMATTKPDFVTNNNEAGTQYVLNGDIVLNEVEDAAQFWNEVTMAMDRRISVTKNNR